MTLARKMAELLLQAARITEAQASEHGLRATEWMALRFLARANQISRTPSALADALATTRATTSQVVKLLEEKELVVRQRSESDGRSVVLCITPKGENTLALDPLGNLLKVLDDLDPQEQGMVGEALRRAVKSNALNRGSRRVDVCQDCVFLARSNAECGTEELKCRLSHATLNRSDLDLLCVFFQPAY